MLGIVNIKEVIMYYDILLGMNFASTIRNREVSASAKVLKYYVNSPSLGTALSVRYWEVSAIGRCPLREVPLYTCMYSMYSSSSLCTNKTSFSSRGS